MAVVFISNGYDTTAGNPYTEGAWADAHPVIGGASYGVRSSTDWKVTAVAGQDRTVSINAGRGYGHGITDKTVANETIQLDTVASGSRWDLIACRRDWTPTSGVSQFVKVNGGATDVIPGGRQANPGGIDDQPIALVQVTAGQTQPTAIIDLRTWSGDGGGVVANHDRVRTYMDAVGTRLHINGIDWVRRVGANDTPEWYANPTLKTGIATLTVGQYGDFTWNLPAAYPTALLSAGMQDASTITNNDYGLAFKIRWDLCDRTKVVGRVYKVGGSWPGAGFYDVTYTLWGN